MRKITKKQLVVGGVAAAVIAAGTGTALAYWSSTGGGSGTANTGTGSTSIIVNQTTPVASLYPGGSVPLAGTFTNNNSGKAYVGTVSVPANGISVDSNHPGCAASNYNVSGTAPVNTEIPVGANQGSWSGLTLNMTDPSDVNQDLCKGATVTVSYVTN